jgi:dienelactone hydrolase
VVLVSEMSGGDPEIRLIGKRLAGAGAFDGTFMGRAACW